MEASLPVRGAWIEIAQKARGFAGKTSLPVRGAWIEIGMYQTPAWRKVAPRAGSVD